MRDEFIRRFPSDPDRLATLADVELVECISHEERFPCDSPNDALCTVSRLRGSATALSYLPTGAVADEPQRWSYDAYYREVVRAANLFNSLGLLPKQSVALLLPNVPEMLFALWGAQAAAIAAPINPFLEAEQIAGITKQADARILVTLGSNAPGGEDLLSKAEAVQGLNPAIETIIVVGENTNNHHHTLEWAEAVAAQPDDRFTFERSRSGGDVAAYFHTGGTTGTPKLAQHTHRAEVLNVCQMNMTGPDLGSRDIKPSRMVNLCGLPLFHVNAVCVSALNAIVNGGELVLAGPQGFRNRQLIVDLWALVERYGVTFFSGVPTVYASLLEQSSEGYDLSSLVSCGCGAAPMPVSLLKEFQARTGADITEGYGMTETTAGAATQYYYGARHVGSVGLRVPYTKTRIAMIDDNGLIARDCDCNEIGSILHNGPNIMPGYKLADNNAGAWPEPGWLNSGDLGRIDADGHLWLAGRAKDLIIRGGHNIDPLVTESALAGHPAVELVAAVGRPDAHSGEVPIAYVQLVQGKTAGAAELKAFAQENATERAAAPVDVIIVEELPTTAVGKIFKPELRKQAIASAYREAAVQACPDTEFKVWVEDDKVLGQIVLFGIISTSDSVDHICHALDVPLKKLLYSWELIL